MKDKLVKNNRKAGYYRFKKFATSFAIGLGLVVVVAIPLTIQYASDLLEAKENTGAEAQEEETESSSSENDTSELLNFEN